MTDSAFTVAQLRGLIGHRVRHHGLVCLVIEVLEDGPALVLQDCAGASTLLNDQYGEPYCYVARTRILQVWTEDGRELSAEFLGLELVECD
jgi:hypothetical protein